MQNSSNNSNFIKIVVIAPINTPQYFMQIVVAEPFISNNSVAKHQLNRLKKISLILYACARVAETMESKNLITHMMYRVAIMAKRIRACIWENNSIVNNTAFSLN